MPVRENFISALHADWDQQCLCYQDRHPDKAFSQSLQKYLEITILLLISVPVDAKKVLLPLAINALSTTGVKWHILVQLLCRIQSYIILKYI